MKAYLFKYRHANACSDNTDTEYCVWKIAKDKPAALRFILKTIPRKIDKRIVLILKRGLPVRMTSIEEYEVSDEFEISKIQRGEPSQGLSNNEEWML